MRVLVADVTHTGAQVLRLVGRRRLELVALEFAMPREGGANCLERLSARDPDVRALARGLADKAISRELRVDRAAGQGPPRQPSSQALRAEPTRRGRQHPRTRDLHRLTPFATGATNGIGSACVAHRHGHAEPEAPEREISALAKGRC